MEIKIGRENARAVYFSKSGEKRVLMSPPISGRQYTKVLLTCDFFGDENALTFLAKSLEVELLLNCNAELLNSYKHSAIALIVCYFTFEPNATLTTEITKVGRFEINVLNNMSMSAMEKIVNGEMNIEYLTPNSTVIKDAERIAKEPKDATGTVLDKMTYNQMTKSLEKTPVRKRSNWSFELKDPKYGNSVIKFEHGKFIDYTKNGPQVVNLLTSEELMQNSHEEVDVLSANGAMHVN